MEYTDYILSRKGIGLTTEAIGNMQKRVNAHLKRDKDAYRIGGHDQEGVSVWALLASADEAMRVDGRRQGRQDRPRPSGNP